MLVETKHNRRNFLLTTAKTVAAAQLGLLGCKAQQPISATESLKVEGDFPSLAGATEWINTKPLTPETLRGKVALAGFCTYTCINWLRQLPFVRAWHEKYKEQGLVVMGVHTPEFEFEKTLDNVRRALKDMNVDYPIAVDNDYAIWRAFKNQYWPALYFIDRQGRIRHHQFGEGDYERSERIIQQLLSEGETRSFDRDTVSVNPSGIEAAADWESLMSPENYVGYERTENFSPRGGFVLEKSHYYSAVAQLNLNEWSLFGDWTIRKQSVSLNKPGGRIAYRFQARDLHLVMEPEAPGTTVRFRVTLDGKPPAAAHGIDVDEQGGGTITAPRLYQLIRQPKPVSARRFEIEFLEAGAAAFAFTFG